MNLKKIALIFHPNRILFKGAFFVFTTATILILVLHLFLQFFFSEERIHHFIDNFANKNGVEIVYDLEISHSWLLNPTINLKNVRLRENQVNKMPFLLAEEIKIKMAYAFLLGKLAIADLIINQADIVFHQKIDKKWILFSSNIALSLPIYEQISVKRLSINNANVFFYQRMLNKVYSLNHTDISWNANLKQKLQLSSQFYQNKHYLGKVNLSSQTFHFFKDNIYLDNAKINYHTDFNYLGLSDFEIKVRKVIVNQQGISGQQTNISGTSSKGTFSAELENWRYFAEHLAILQGKGTFLAKIDQHWDGDFEFATFGLKADFFKLGQAKIALKKDINNHSFILKAQGDLNYLPNKEILDADNIIISSEQINKLNNRNIFSALLKGKIKSNHQKNINFSLKGDINQHDLNIEGNYNHQTKTWLTNLNLATLDLNLLTKIPVDFPNFFDILISKTNFVLDNLADKTYQTNIKIAKIKSDSFELSRFSMNILANEKQIVFSDIVASIYGGQSFGKLIIYKKDKIYAAIEHNLKNIKIDPWLYNWLGINNIVGIGDSQIKLTVHGNELNEFKQSLTGKTVIRLADGSINGVDIPFLLNKIEEIGSLEHFKQQFPFDINKKTPFKVFSAQTIWENGIGNTLATTMYGQNFYLSGQGQINLPDNKLDYLLSIYYDVTKFGRKREIILPLRINGELDQPVYSLDYQSIVQGSLSEKEKKQALLEFIYKRWGIHP